MKTVRFTVAAIVALTCAQPYAAPDEELLGKAWGYPLAPNLLQAFAEPYRVGSFSGMDLISPHCNLEPSAAPLPLEKANEEPAFRYRFAGQTLSVEDYMQRQRVTVLLVLKDGQIVVERSNYGRKPEQRMLSNSMAKTIVALAIGKALQEGHIRSLDDTAATYEPRLAGTLYGETPIIHLMRMASGARFVEDYSGRDDLARFNQAARARGTVAGASVISERVAPAGTRFNYASAETQMLALALRGATGQSLCQYVSEKLWQPMGAESRATWLTNPSDRVEMAAGNFNATARDYARLGWLLANDGQRDGQPVIPSDYLLQMTDANRQPEHFRPGHMQIGTRTVAVGYGLQTWLLAGSQRRFMLLGVYGQAILVDPQLKLVVVHLAAGKDASGDASGTHMTAERQALFQGIVTHYSQW